jgi:hypothetical protein
MSSVRQTVKRFTAAPTGRISNMMKDYPKAIVTRDGTSVLLRPVVPSDEEALRTFFASIPQEERWFLRENLSDPQLLHQWIEALDYDYALPIIAVREDDGTIVSIEALRSNLNPSAPGSLACHGSSRIPRFKGGELDDFG